MYMTVKSECAFELTLNSAMLGVSVVEGGVKEWEPETVGAPSVNRRREREVILAISLLSSPSSAGHLSGCSGPSAKGWGICYVTSYFLR